MRNTVKVVLFLCALITISVLQNGSVNALSNKDFALTEDPFYQKAKLDKKKQEAEVKEAEQKAAEKQKAEEEARVKAEQEKANQPIVHVVQSGESLSTIAAQHGTTWKRLFDKNTEIADPNILAISASITIPKTDEQLTERPLPVAIEPVVPVQMARSTGATARSTAPRYQVGSSAGNTYAPGYCTWYAKSRRPDLPNRMGNAISWVSSAATAGFATGSTPRVGAIGQQGNHVVYVESVNGDGTVTVSEMNYKGLYIVSSRTVSAGAFTYIY